MKLDITELPNHIKKVRKLVDVTQEEISKQLEMDRSNYSKKERGLIPFTLKEFRILQDLFQPHLDNIIIKDTDEDIKDKDEIKLDKNKLSKIIDKYNNIILKSIDLGDDELLLVVLEGMKNYINIMIDGITNENFT